MEFESSLYVGHVMSSEMPDVLRIPIYREYIRALVSVSPVGWCDNKEVLFNKHHWKIDGKVKGLKILFSYKHINVVACHRCELCKRFFFIGEWDLKGLRHSPCTDPVL